MAVVTSRLWQMEQHLQTVCRLVRQRDMGSLPQHFATNADLEYLLIDSTIIRAHPCAAGALKKPGSQQEQALGRSRGGFSTKIHIAVDALGNPLRLLLTAGQRHDIGQAAALIDGFEGAYVIADKSYDADPFRQTITDLPRRRSSPLRPIAPNSMTTMTICTKSAI